MTATRLTDLIIPSVFTPYALSLTREKSAIIQSGAATEQPFLNDWLNSEQGGMTIAVPFFKDLENDAENISTDDPASDSTPVGIKTGQELAIRLSRNQSWSSMDLNAALAGKDPMNAIAQRVAAYWARRQQLAFVQTLKGIFADNDAAPTGTEHVIGDLTKDVSAGGVYTAGVTDFSAAAFIDALQTMGDGQDVLAMVMVHSVVFSRMQKNNLIDFAPDSEGKLTIPTFMGKRVIVDDGMPTSAGVHETWIFGNGAVALGMGSPKVPTETDRLPSKGTGGGQDVLYNRVEWAIHPVGHAWVGATTASGGPTNATLANAASFQRVYRERKQISIARLKTTEF